MGDCHDRNRGAQQPEPPTLKALARAWGEPPWTYVVPRPELLPDEAIELIGAVELGGARFVREDREGARHERARTAGRGRVMTRNPFYRVADVLGVSCADRTDEVIAENMMEALRHGWMKLPVDYEGQPVRPGEAVNVSTSYGSEDWRFAKVMGIGECNHVVLDVPGFDYPQNVNAHSVREAAAADDYGNEMEGGE